MAPGESLHLSDSRFPRPHSGEDISLTGLLRSYNQDSLGLIMVTNTICCQEAQKDLRIREELSEAPGPGLQKTHDCETRGRFSSWGFRPQVLRRRLFAPDLITRPAGASHSHCFSSLGVGRGHVSVTHSSPPCSTSQTPVPARDLDP